MTHFTVGLIVPPDKLAEIHEFAADQMASYDEDLRVAPYVCYTVEQAKAEIERDIQRLEHIIERQNRAYDLDQCRESLANLRSTPPEDRYRENLAYHTRFNLQGEPLSTYNPNSKWDWWVIGGRWDGWITGNESRRNAVEDNLAPTEQALQRGIIPHAIVTPDGQWHERGQMGWWAVLITEDENWDAQAKEILASYPGHQLLILDAHI